MTNALKKNRYPQGTVSLKWTKDTTLHITPNSILTVCVALFVIYFIGYPAVDGANLLDGFLQRHQIGIGTEMYIPRIRITLSLIPVFILLIGVFYGIVSRIRTSIIIRASVAILLSFLATVILIFPFLVVDFMFNFGR